MKSIFKYLLYACLCLLLIVSLYPKTPWAQTNQQDQVRITLQKWCRLGAFPKNRKNEVFQVDGGMMTRGFDYVFFAKPTALKKWKKNSPGLLDAHMTNKGTFVHYQIKPLEAQFCEVEMDETTGRVGIRAYWS